MGTEKVKKSTLTSYCVNVNDIDAINDSSYVTKKGSDDKTKKIQLIIYGNFDSMVKKMREITMRNNETDVEGITKLRLIPVSELLEVNRDITIGTLWDINNKSKKLPCEISDAENSD